ncbi:MAG: hypothetical protein ACI934_001551, partial [Pseudohongiellaceae bacterium]
RQELQSRTKSRRKKDAVPGMKILSKKKEGICPLFNLDADSTLI